MADRTTLTDELGRVLRENGLVRHPMTPEDVEQGIHAWRCGHPEYRDQPCTCFDGLVSDLEAVVAARVAEALRDAAHRFMAGDAHRVLFNKNRRDETPEQRVAHWLRDLANEYDPQEEA